MIRLSFLVIGLISLIYGSVLLIIPEWFVNLSNAEKINIAWLRSIGASIIGLLFLGCMIIFFKPSNKMNILKIITTTSILQTFSLIYSRFYNEFSAKNIIVIDLSIFLATFVCIYFVLIMLFKYDHFK